MNWKHAGSQLHERKKGVKGANARGASRLDQSGWKEGCIVNGTQRATCNDARTDSESSSREEGTICKREGISCEKEINICEKGATSSYERGATSCEEEARAPAHDL